MLKDCKIFFSKLGCLVFLGCLGPVLLNAQYGGGIELNPVVSPVNGLEVSPVAQGQPFHFYAAGHIFGMPGNSVYPSPTILTHLDEINQAEISFFMSLGDNFRQMDSLHIQNFQSSFSNKLNVPMFNALGNHDLMPHRFDDYWSKDYDAYTKVFGPNYYRFRLGGAMFVVLDAELEVHKIDGEQLEFFRTTLDQECSGDKGIQNLVIFSHKMLWNNPEYGNFRSTILPILVNTSKKVPVHWFSGDLPSHPMIYRKVADHEIHYYGVALADDKADILLDVKLDGKGGLEVIPISLTDVQAPALSSFYSEEVLPDEWIAPENIVKPKKKKKGLSAVLDHNYFWKGVMGGAGVMLILALIFFFVRRK